MHKQWLGCAAENFRKGRPDGCRPEAIVLHASGGSADALAARFRDPHSATSAHYLVAKDGSVQQFVDEGDTAFHAGLAVDAVWTLLKRKMNPNFYTLGIELEAGSPEFAEVQYDAAAALIAELAGRWNIAVDAAHVPLHSEVRASRDCPGQGFDRGKLLARAAAAALRQRPGKITPLETSVRLVGSARVRECAPSTTARVVAILAKDTEVPVSGFTDCGTRVDGNACWYQTQDGDFVWAGLTDRPQPAAVPPALPVNVAPPQPAGSRRCGIARIDGLFTGAPVPAIAPGDPDRDAVGAIQDLLSGHGFRGLPTLLSPAYGAFAQRTTDALHAFQAAHQLPLADAVDAGTLQALVTVPALDPRVNRVYLGLALGFPCDGLYKVLSLVAQMEGMGKFGALNLNTDAAGLSFGIIQWAQRPGRLADILGAFRTAVPDAFLEIFGGGDAAVAAGLLAHVRSPNGGVVRNTGISTDTAFNLVADRWVLRFRQAAVDPRFQAAQVQIAIQAFEASLNKIRRFAAPVVSERGIAFMLDVANQFGDGGLEGLYHAVVRDGMGERDILEAIADLTVDRIQDKFKQGVRSRRDGFLHTALLSDKPFAEAARA